MDTPSVIGLDGQASGTESAANDLDWITTSKTSLAKGMLARGDRPSDIAVFLGVSEERIAEIDRGTLYPTAPVAPPSALPPPAPNLHDGIRARFFDLTFSGSTVDIDGNAYVRCTFERCTIRYRGSGPVSLDGCTFTECALSLIGLAAMMTELLRMLHQSHGNWGRHVVETVLDDIRGCTDTNDPAAKHGAADDAVAAPQFFDAALAREHDARAIDKRRCDRSADHAVAGPTVIRIASAGRRN